MYINYYMDVSTMQQILFVCIVEISEKSRMLSTALKCGRGLNSVEEMHLEMYLGTQVGYKGQH
jgi:hypothetical protein